MTDLGLASFDEICDEIQRRYPVSAIGVVSYQEGAPHEPILSTAFKVDMGGPSRRSRLELVGLTSMLLSAVTAWTFKNGERATTEDVQ